MNDTGAECAAREITLNAVVDDAQIIAEHITTLEAISLRIHDHLMGVDMQLKQPGQERERETEIPPPSGVLPGLCRMNGNNIGRLQGLRERLNQISYELGEKA